MTDRSGMVRWWLAVGLVMAGCASGGGRTGMDAGPGGFDAGEAPMDAETEPDVGPPGGDAGLAPHVACTAASADVLCGGRPCVDGYCCDQPCDGDCVHCGLAGSEGTCTSYAAGEDPESDCAEETPDTCGTTGTCDGAGGCAYFDTSVSCDDGLVCTTGDACNGTGECRGAAPADCAPMPGNECCLATCDAGGGCLTEPGTCSDVCGGSMLTVSRDCQGCGGPRAAGSCFGGAVHVCDASNHSACQQVTCGGAAYYCTNVAGTWAWRTSAACDDLNACTHSDACGGGTCAGTPVTCTSTTCVTRTCNGTATCSETVNDGVSCDDGNACTYADACNTLGVCVGGGTVTCTGTTCLDRTCNGTATCTETPRTGSCNDGNACTFNDTCNGSGTCAAGTPVTCPADTPCRTYACNGTATCTATPRNVGGACDDGSAATPIDRCQADGTCAGFVCPSTLTSVFAEDFGTPTSTSWTEGTDAPVNTSRWRAYTNERHGVRITSGRMEITNVRSGSPDHGYGLAYVRTDGVNSVYDNSRYDSQLDANVGHEIVWSFNMRRSNASGSDGGFSCSRTDQQNNSMVGVAYVLAANSITGLGGNASTCSAVPGRAPKRRGRPDHPGRGTAHRTTANKRG